MRSILLSLFVLALAAVPASACINDREVIQAEKEFKSRYLEKETQPVPEYQPEQATPMPLLAMGGVLFAVSTFLFNRRGIAEG